MKDIEIIEQDPFILSAAAIRRLAARRIVERGMDYAFRGRVLEAGSRAGRLEAKVEGSAGEPYLVTIVDDGDGELLPSCTCPFDWEPWCKHAVAALAHASGITEDAWKKFQASAEPERPEEEQVEARRERGWREPLKVRPVQGGSGGGGWALRFTVSSSSAPGPGAAKRYDVEIRSLSRRLNTCSCPDYEHSMLGTCKHIEAVLHRLGRLPASRRTLLARRLEGVPRVLLSREGGPRIIFLPPSPDGDGPGRGGRRRLALPDPAAARILGRLFDSRGVLRGDPEKTLPRLQGIRGLTIGKDVSDCVERLAAEREDRARRSLIRKRLCAAGFAVPGFRAALFPYQAEGMTFLAGTGRALLADDMGLGKTAQAIAAAQVLQHEGLARRALVVCPASLKRQWADEIRKFTACTSAVVRGPRAERKEIYGADRDFIIANYEVILRDADLVRGCFDLLIVDEAQRIKNWRTRTADAVKSIGADFTFVLTGTPLENRLDDLYSLMQLIDRRIFGPLWAFNEKFISVEKKEGRRVTVYRNLGELRRRLRPVMLRRDRSEVLAQLPDKTVNRYYVPLTPAQEALMVDAEAAAAVIAARALKRPLTPEEMKRLQAHLQTARMACNAVRLVDPRGPDESPKLEEFARLIEEVCLEAGRKAVVFSQWEKFQRMAARRAEALGIGHVRLHGGVPTEKRGDLIDRFRDDPACRIFFSTDAGGVGLNLQWASVVVNLELPWNPAVLEQRIGRVHRYGQKEHVNVILVTSENSFEHKMEKLLAGKRELFDAAVLPGEGADEVEVPSMALAVARALYADLRIEDAAPGEIEKQIRSFYAGDGDGTGSGDGGYGAGEGIPQDLRLPAPEIGAAAPALAAGDETAVAAALPPGDGTRRAALTPAPPETAGGGENASRLLGPRLRCLLRLPSSHTVAVVDSVDALTLEAARGAGAVAIDEKALDALMSLGTASPLAGAVIVEDRRSGPASAAGPQALQDEQERKRTEWLSIAGRRLKAAESMAGTGLAAEALSMALGSIEAAMRAGAVRAGREARDLPGMLYEIMVPAGLITIEQAAVASRAEGVVRAYAETTLPPPSVLVDTVLGDARGILSSLSTR